MTLHILQLILPEMVRAALKDAARPEPVAVLELPAIVASQDGKALPDGVCFQPAPGYARSRY